MLSVLMLLYMFDGGIHIDFTLSLGSVLIAGSIMSATLVINRRLTIFMLEHEVLAHDYAYRVGIKRSELLTHARSPIPRTNGQTNGAAAGKG